MIRFLSLKHQICEGSYDFAFYDTISDTICYFGEQQQQVFGDVFGFQYAYGQEKDKTTRPIERFLSLIPENYFEE
jgi:hypothetical protein